MKILMLPFCGNAQSAVSWYRGQGVFNRIDGIMCEFAVASEITKAKLAGYDLLFIERPALQDQLRAIEMAQTMGKPVWVDFDDDYFHVPKDSPAFSYHNQESTKQIILKCCAMASTLSFESRGVAASFRNAGYTGAFVVLPNCHNDLAYPFAPNFSEAKSLVWRGSEHHLADVREHLEAMMEFAQSKVFPADWRWEWLGGGEALKATIPFDGDFFPAVPISEYYSRISTLGGIWHYPVRDDEFSRNSKSPIAWIEATYAGAVMVGPDFPEWQKPGIENYSDSTSFTDKLDLLMNDRELRVSRFHESVQYIKENLVLSVVNRKRKEILDSLVPKVVSVNPIRKIVKISIVILLWNRYNNLERWLNIIKQLTVEDCEFTVIHNEDPKCPSGIQEKVVAAGIRYISRSNVGMDIGALQDVCRRRLAGFNYDYEFLIWCCDDTFPMEKDFANKFLEPFKSTPSPSVTCMEISSQISRHVRTSGFCVRKQFAEKLKFHKDPINTKDDGYIFEHRHTNLTLYLQAMAQTGAVQIAPLSKSPLWDSGGGGHGYVNRREELERRWGPGMPGSKVLVIAPAFLSSPVVVASMLAQTYHNWELWLIHDGPAVSDYATSIDSRIKFIENPGPKQNHGHPIRQEYLQKLRSGAIKGNYLVIANHSTYYAPFFLERLAKALDENITAVAAYCSAMIRADGSHGNIELKPGFIEPDAVMLRTKFAGTWPSLRESSGWDYLNTIAQTTGGWKMWKSVPGCMVTHNENGK